MLPKSVLMPLVVSLSLAACMPVVVVPSDGADTCGASSFQYLVGEHRSELDGMRFSQPVRIIPEGGVVTMDYNPNRLNFQLDGAGRVERVYCG
jgi:hypothetical protein